MPQPLTANDLLPLIPRLAPDERTRLVRLIEARSTKYPKYGARGLKEV
jgi:hypothetical protein